MAAPSDNKQPSATAPGVALPPPSLESYLDAVAAARAGLPGQSVPWVRRLREEAATRFAELGFPTTRHEDWKYTNVSAIERHPYAPAPAGASAGVGAAQLETLLFTGIAAHRLVFVNGRYAPSLSGIGALPTGVTVGGLAEMLATQPDKLEPHLGKYVPANAQGFAVLNTALLVDGAYIHLARGTAVEQPIYLVFVATHADALMASPRNLVVAEAGSQATIIEQYVALDEGRYFTNAITEAVLARNSHVEHYRFQQESPKAHHISGWHVHQGRDSGFTSHTVDMGGLLARNDLNSRLDAEGAECEFNGLYVVDGHRHVDNHTCVDHAKPHGTSREFYKGVLDGQARAVFNGRVVVHPDAQHTDAQQMNNNLLLSKTAEVDTKPQLEIYADDVKCSHGATVGSLDEDALFYLRTRAIDEAAARDLLTYAFANDVLSRMKLPAIRLQLEQRLTTRLLHGRTLRELELI